MHHVHVATIRIPQESGSGSIMSQQRMYSMSSIIIMSDSSASDRRVVVVEVTYRHVNVNILVATS
jgi:hypothetical protein